MRPGSSDLSSIKLTNGGGDILPDTLIEQANSRVTLLFAKFNDPGNLADTQLVAQFTVAPRAVWGDALEVPGNTADQTGAATYVDNEYGGTGENIPLTTTADNSHVVYAIARIYEGVNDITWTGATPSVNGTVYSGGTGTAYDADGGIAWEAVPAAGAVSADVAYPLAPNQVIRAALEVLA